MSLAARMRLRCAWRSVLGVRKVVRERHDVAVQLPVPPLESARPGVSTLVLTESGEPPHDFMLTEARDFAIPDAIPRLLLRVDRFREPVFPGLPPSEQPHMPPPWLGSGTWHQRANVCVYSIS